MYRVGTPQQFGPGNALVERYGMSGYASTQNYFSTPAGLLGIRGMGCPNCDGNCGMGQTGIFGTSLFESSDPSTWGWGEWATILVGGYVVLSVFDTTKRAARATHRKSKAVRKALAA
jgi:hypothetical protein